MNRGDIVIAGNSYERNRVYPDKKRTGEHVFLADVGGGICPYICAEVRAYRHPTGVYRPETYMFVAPTSSRGSLVGGRIRGTVFAGPIGGGWLNQAQEGSMKRGDSVRAWHDQNEALYEMVFLAEVGGGMYPFVCAEAAEYQTGVYRPILCKNAEPYNEAAIGKLTLVKDFAWGQLKFRPGDSVTALKITGSIYKVFLSNGWWPVDESYFETAPTGAGDE